MTEFEVMTSEFDESTIKEKNPQELVEKLAMSKAREVFKKVESSYDDLIVIGGDTVVYFNGKILVKLCQSL